MTAEIHPPLDMQGSPHARGLAQAMLCPDSRQAVRAQFATRFDGMQDLLARRHIRNFLAAQWDFALRHDAEGMAELAGVAEGYDLDPQSLFAVLHAGQLGGVPEDGCSAWAYVDPDKGAMLVKNRDLRGPALPLQRIFRHADPAWGGRIVLCVGSLGAPGAYSSGINSDGLALVDTQVVTTDQGTGLLRYFAMTRLLAHCASVDAAIEELHSLPQAGGGTLVLADATGAIAAVEIGHSTVAVARPARDWVARTNHFLSPDLANRLLKRTDDPGIDDSHGRLARLDRWLAARPHCPTTEEAASLMASHSKHDAAGLCRHGHETGSSTVSCSIFACALGTLDFAGGNPCEGAWSRYAVADDAGAGDGVRDGSDR